MRKRFGQKSLLDYATPDSRKKIIERMERLRAGEPVPSEFEQEIERSDGEIRLLSLQVSDIEYEGKQCRQSTFIDITDKRHLEQSEERFQFIGDNIQDLIIVFDSQFKLLYANQAFEEFYGYSIDDFKENSVFEIVHPDDIGELRKETQQRMASQARFQSSEYRVITKSGELKWVETRSTYHYDSSGNLDKVLLVIRDRTKHKESEERLKAIIENMSVMLYAVDEQVRIVAWNRECERVTGYSAEEMMQHPEPMKILYPDDDYQNGIAAATPDQGFDIRYNERRLRSKDGEDRYISWSNISQRFPIEGWHIWATGIDTTERRRAEEQLARNKKTLELALYSATMGVWKWHVESGKVEWAGEHATLFGIPLDQFGGTIDDVQSFVYPDDREKGMDVFQNTMETGEDFDNIYRVVWPDDSIHWMHSYGKLFFDGKGQPDYILGTTTDITRRKEAEHKLNIALEEKAGLLVELQHRAKNSFATISSLISLKKDVMKTEEARQALNDLHIRVLALNELYSILHYTNSPDKIDLGIYCAKVVESVMRVTNAIKIETDLDSIESNTKRAATIGLIITELLTNTIKYAFPGNRKGTVSVSLKKDDNQILLCITDDGVGFSGEIDPENLESIGLQLVQQLVRGLRGRLNLESTHGVRASITFPFTES